MLYAQQLSILFHSKASKGNVESVSATNEKSPSYYNELL